MQQINQRIHAANIFRLNYELILVPVYVLVYRVQCGLISLCVWANLFPGLIYAFLQ